MTTTSPDRLGLCLEWAGRLALVALFLPAGVGKLSHLAGVAGLIASKGLPFPLAVAAVTAVFELAASLALLLGWQQRWTALALAVFTLLAGLLFHDFWTVAEAQRMAQQQAFFKNIGIFGGLLLLAARSPRGANIYLYRKES